MLSSSVILKELILVVSLSVSCWASRTLSCSKQSNYCSRGRADGYGAVRIVLLCGRDRHLVPVAWIQKMSTRLSSAKETPPFLLTSLPPSLPPPVATGNFQASSQRCSPGPFKVPAALTTLFLSFAFLSLSCKFGVELAVCA